jgi:hypothetical protein
MTMKRKFVDYHGPTGAFIATDQGILPLTSAEGMAAAMDSAMLVSLGHTEKAAEYQRLLERRRAASVAAKHPARA